jgi:hypothetical protein
VVALAVHPTSQGNSLSNVGGTKVAARMGFIHDCAPEKEG